MPDAILYIQNDGTIRGVYSDSFAPLLTQGEVQLKRASHVEPGRDNKGVPCWYADLSPSGGPTLGPFYLRSQALKSEVEWLNKNLFKYESEM